MLRKKCLATLGRRLEEVFRFTFSKFLSVILGLAAQDTARTSSFLSLLFFLLHPVH